MRYQTPADFRSALEQRLANQATEAGVRVDRLRRLTVFERILARLTVSDPGMWVIKGGLALEYRWPAHARTTKDLDLATRLEPTDGAQLHEHLMTVLAQDPDGDRFVFVVSPPKLLRSDQAGRPGWRFSIRSKLAGREFDTVTVDIVQRMEEIAETEVVAAPNSLAFAEIPSREVEMVTTAQHFAEKLHALTRDYGRESTRVRDLVDIALLIERGNVAPAAAMTTATAVFEIRDAHVVPTTIPDPPVDWADRYTSLAAEVGLRARSIAEAMDLLRAFWAAACTATDDRS